MANKSLSLRPKGNDSLDQIVQYMTDLTGTYILDKDTMKMMERMNYAHDHLRAFWSEKDIVILITNEFKVSDRTAYNDIDHARYIHGKVSPLNLTYEIKNLLEISKINIKSSIEDHDNKALAKAIEARVKILKLIEEDKSIDWSKLNKSSYNLILNFNGDQNAVKIDLNKVEQLTPEAILQIQEKLEDKFDAELIEALEVKEDEQSGN